MPSPANKLDQQDLIKVAKGAGLAAAGAAAVYLAEWASNTDFGQWSPTITALAAIGLNLIRKWIKDN
jgi:hypothetical protein